MSFSFYVTGDYLDDKKNYLPFRLLLELRLLFYPIFRSCRIQKDLGEQINIMKNILSKEEKIVAGSIIT